MAIISQNVNALRSKLTSSIYLEDYLRQQIIPKIPHKNIDLSKLDPYAVQVSIICVWHDETQPSLRLFRKHSQDHFDDFYCFGSCRTGGGIVEMHKHTMAVFYNRQMSYLQAMESLADMYNIRYDELYFNPEETRQKIKNTGITQEDILDFMVNEKYKQIVVPSEHYGAYTELVERSLKKIKLHSFEEYIHSVTDVDYLFSLGLSEDELCLELSSMNRQLETSLLQFKI